MNSLMAKFTLRAEFKWYRWKPTPPTPYCHHRHSLPPAHCPTVLDLDLLTLSLHLAVTLPLKHWSSSLLDQLLKT